MHYNIFLYTKTQIHVIKIISISVFTSLNVLIDRYLFIDDRNLSPELNLCHQSSYDILLYTSYYPFPFKLELILPYN